MFQPIQFQVRLVHAESGNRVVEVRALRGSTPLGSALGEATNAEEAEQRALDRLLSRLGPLEEPPASNTPIPADTSPPADPPLNLSAHPPAHPLVPAPVTTPAAEAPASGQGTRLPSAPVLRPATNSPPRAGTATNTPAAPPPAAAPPPQIRKTGAANWRAWIWNCGGWAGAASRRGSICNGPSATPAAAGSPATAISRPISMSWRVCPPAPSRPAAPYRCGGGIC